MTNHALIPWNPNEPSKATPAAPHWPSSTRPAWPSSNAPPIFVVTNVNPTVIANARSQSADMATALLLGALLGYLAAGITSDQERGGETARDESSEFATGKQP